MLKLVKAQWGLVGLAMVISAASCEFDERNVHLSQSVQSNQPGVGDAGPVAGGNASSDGGLVGGSPSQAGPELQLSPENVDFGSAVVGFGALRRVSVTNVGDAPITELVVRLTPDSNPALVIAQNQCLTELGAGLSCEVVLQFLPTETGQVSGVLEAVSGDRHATLAVSGTGAEQGDLVLLPNEGSSADFGSTLLGSAVEAVFSIDNPLDVESGVITVDLANPAFALQAPAAGECQPGVTSLLGGTSCNLRVAFQPTARGANDATLTATSAQLGSVSLALHGVALAPGALALDSSLHDFAGVVLGSAGQASVSVGNSGDVPLTLSETALAAGSDAAFSITSSNCGAGTVLGGETAATCSVQLEFRPTQVNVAMGALAITAEGAVEQSITLRGEGLLPGSLVVEPDANASADFGQLLIGASATRRFRVSNPGAEPSGAITPLASGGFEPTAPSAADDCVPGTTSLVDGAGCFVSVRLTAPARGPIRGSLTINSALAGSKSIDLQAVGLLPATLGLDRQQVDFGRRIVRGDTATGSITVRNTGDVAMSAPALSLGTATSGQASAFSYESSCPATIPAGGQCTVALRFAPTQTTAHSVTLNLTSNPGGSSSVLLVAGVVEPGSLLLQAAAGSSANFGDVALNTTATRNFVLTNPGGVASGRITLTTSDARFNAAIGNCNPGGAGLVDGSSCTFSVTFTPNSSESLSPSLTATSVGAGTRTLSLAARGRNPAHLTASNDFNFNTVIRGESAAARSWTVTNDGDLSTGALTTTGGNTEFTIASNTCTASLAGKGTCSMLVGFTPQDNGNRSRPITVSDGTNSVTLNAHGIGQPLPAVGAACLDGRCAGTASCENHSNGQSLVCCAQNCTGNQRCSESTNFASCALPTVGQGQGCGASVACGAGLTCNGTTQTCCVSNCGGACRACNTNGTCGNVADGQRGGCTANQVCAGGVCGNCTPGDRRCNPNNSRVAQVCSATGAFQDQTPTCQFVCDAGFCGGECVPNSLRCSPATGRPQICSSTGTWMNNGPACGTASCENGACVCGSNQNLCTDGTTVTCSNKVFGFEDGTLQGWAARAGTTTAPIVCGDAFSSCLFSLNANNLAGFAHGGQFFADARGFLYPESSARRLSVTAPLCGLGSRATTNLVGQTIRAFMYTGSQGGSFAGNTFSIALSGPNGPPVIVGTIDASTPAGAQTTGWRNVSAVAPDNSAARAANSVILSLELPGAQSAMSFDIDDVTVGD